MVTAGIEPVVESSFLGLIVLCPLAGSILTYLLTSRTQKLHPLSGVIATLAALLSFFCVLKSFNLLDGMSGGALVYTLGTWFQWGPGADEVLASLAFRFDHLSAVMCLVITGVGTLIHVYSIGYMHEDLHRPRFFAYLNLFLFAMLVLVLADNLPVLFIGWEGVGLCSYLLIGFWFKEMSNAVAGQKAFVVNRIGDAGFLLGMFVLFVVLEQGGLGTLSFEKIQLMVEQVSSSGSSAALASVFPLTDSVITLICILLFVGAVGKSAQIPLYVWLPDAMAGPTPVSALIHAATMVTAGVYMITRMSFLYVHSEVAMTVILVVGTITAFVAATIALVQNDIKKVLAYSTVSQLGYMFMALGVAAFSNGIFHVVTHAFFKACLFMGAGSVIIGCHHEQDMRKFGGLAKKMPLTFVTFLASTLAIAGIPYTSGFFSKDAILWTVFSSEGLASRISLAGINLSVICWGIGVITAFLTAFYMTRALVLTFFGEYRGEHHPHESSPVVTFPLIILAGLALCFGFIYGEELIHYLGMWTRKDMLLGEEVLAHNAMYEMLEHLSMAIAVGGVGAALIIYLFLPAIPSKLSVRMFPDIYRFLLDKWRVDELYNGCVVSPLRGVAQVLFRLFDRILIDGTVNAVGMVVEASGEAARVLQRGSLNLYALYMFIGSMVLTIFWLIL